jgi:hypothetical protein
MNKIKLQEEHYYTYSKIENNFVVSGEITGEFILLENIKSDDFQTIICIDTNEIFLISK